jgi:hypothetical protein
VEARFSATVQFVHEAHTNSYVKGTESFPGVQWPDRGVDYSPHLEPRLKKEWCYISTSPLSLLGLP